MSADAVALALEAAERRRLIGLYEKTANAAFLAAAAQLRRDGPY